jgi:hypothetical protein
MWRGADLKNIVLSLAVLMLAVPPDAVACKPVAGRVYKAPTDSERVAAADAVFTGRVVSSTEAPALNPHPMSHPYTYIYVLEVDNWEKGGTGSRVEVVDNAGTNCDHLYSVSHIVGEAQLLPSGAIWRVFAKQSKGRLWVTTAVSAK